jgi:hypothetical protein
VYRNKYFIFHLYLSNIYKNSIKSFKVDLQSLLIQKIRLRKKLSYSNRINNTNLIKEINAGKHKRKELIYCLMSDFFLKFLR